MKLLILVTLFIDGAFSNANPLDEINRNHSICFAKEYSNKDLRPHQTVTSMHADLSQQPDERDQTIYLNLKIIANGRHFDSFMICDRNGLNLKCMVECDGGHAEIRVVNNGEIEFINGGFLMSGGCGGQNQEEPVVWLNPSQDGDGVFNLPAAPCE